MSVIIDGVQPGSPAYRAGLRAGDTLLSIGENEIADVLDYRFYQSSERIEVKYINKKGHIKKAKIKKSEYDELGLSFETYLMDKQHSCRNKCIFCFIDQLPKGLRKSLYFKDDDSRLSFLFGNYITLTNISKHEIERIIKLHISPINISVHTTNPELRVRMMKNKNAGSVLSLMDRFNAAGIKLNCQLVLCPGINDGAELERTLTDLCGLENVECIAAVPVGITAYRDGLERLEPFNSGTAGAVMDIIDRFGDESLRCCGRRRVYASDEFYILAGREIPDAEYYGDFLQLENGVGMWALLKSRAEEALEELEEKPVRRRISVATGEAAYPLICDIVRLCREKNPLLDCTVYAVKNEFFGGKITVSGLVTATDILKQLGDKSLGEELLIPATMLRSEGDMFLDDITLTELSERLGVAVRPIANDGFELTEAILGI